MVRVANAIDQGTWPQFQIRGKVAATSGKSSIAVSVVNLTVDRVAVNIGLNSSAYLLRAFQDVAAMAKKGNL